VWWPAGQHVASDSIAHLLTTTYVETALLLTAAGAAAFAAGDSSLAATYADCLSTAVAMGLRKCCGSESWLFRILTTNRADMSHRARCRLVLAGGHGGRGRAERCHTRDVRGSLMALSSRTSPAGVRSWSQRDGGRSVVPSTLVRAAEARHLIRRTVSSTAPLFISGRSRICARRARRIWFVAYAWWPEVTWILAEFPHGLAPH